MFFVPLFRFGFVFRCINTMYHINFECVILAIPGQRLLINACDYLYVATFGLPSVLLRIFLFIFL